MNERHVKEGPDEQQRRRIRRTALLLGLTAVAIYVAFIVSGILKAQG